VDVSHADRLQQADLRIAPRYDRGVTLARRTLGGTGLTASRLGLGASYGTTATDVERAFDNGINYFYWGALARPAFGRGIARLATKHRDDMVIVMQSSRPVALMKPKLEYELRRLGIDRADFLLLGWRDTEPAERVRDVVGALKDEGKIARR